MQDERDEAADEAQPVAVEPRADRAPSSGSQPSAPSSVAVRPSAAISASTRSGGSCRPQPGTSQTPHEMGAPASRLQTRRRVDRALHAVSVSSVPRALAVGAL